MGCDQARNKLFGPLEGDETERPLFGEPRSIQESSDENFGPITPHAPEDGLFGELKDQKPLFGTPQPVNPKPTSELFGTPQPVKPTSELFGEPRPVKPLFGEPREVPPLFGKVKTIRTRLFGKQG